MACCKLHVINTYTVPETGTALTLNFSNAVASATDKQRFCIKVCTNIPSTYSTYTANVTIGTTTVPLWDKYGNPLTISELTKCRVIKGYYGATTPHIILDAPKTYNCGCADVL